MDSHADTCVAGANFVLFDKPSRFVNVYAYSEEYKPLKDIAIATVATVWVDPKTAQEYLLLINEALFFGKRMKHSLINPNQLRANGTEVDDCPRQFRLSSRHAIRLKGDPPVTIPLKMRGVISCFDTTRPKPSDLDDLPRLELTSRLPWEPQSKHFAKAEAKLMDYSSDDEVFDNMNRETQIASVQTADVSSPDEFWNQNRCISAVSAANESSSCVEYSSEDDLYHRLIAHVHVASDDVPGDGMSGRADSDVYEDTTERRQLSSLSTTERRHAITPEILSRRWNIGLVAAKKTIRVTTQAGVRNVLAPSERKVRKKAPWLKFPSVKGKFYCDAMFSKVPSIHGDKGGTVFTNGYGYDRFYPWKSKREHPDTIMSFIHDVGVPQVLVSDGAKEEIEGRAKATCQEYRIAQKVTVPYSPWQNLAEGCVRELKKGTRSVLRRTGAPKRLWSYGALWVAAIRRLTALDIPQLNGRVPEEYVNGSTPDIAPYAMFDFYELIWYYTPTPEFPHQKKVLGRYLGVAENSTDPLAFVILSKSGTPIMRKDVWALSDDERKTPAIMEQIVTFNDAIKEKFDVTEEKDRNLEQFPYPPDDLFEYDETVEPMDQAATQAEADEFTPEALDEYLSAELRLPHGGDYAHARVTGRKRDSEGNPIGLRNANPILDTRVYEVEFPDGSTDAFSANIIAENLFSQIDDEGHAYQILKEITDHRKDDLTAIPKDDGFFITKSGRKQARHTTIGWELLVEWKDGTTSWIPLKELKNSNPVEVAEYAVANKIAEEPAFAWWVRHTLRRRDRIIKKVKTRYWRRTHKFGIELPKTVDEALRIDLRTGTDFWTKAIEKEMKNVMPAFEFRDDNTVPIGYKHIDCHLIFDVKTDLTRKARYVAGGHQTDPPKESTYSSVVSRDSVRIAFTLAALNGLDVLAGDVQNAYLNAPTTERCYTTAGMEFGKDRCGRPVLIVRALYGLKSSGARWRDHMAATLRDAGFEGSKADPDVWMRKAVKPDGFKYWEYVLCYSDDLLVMSHDPKSVMDFLSKRYTMKEGSVREPTDYLGAQVRKFTIDGDDGPDECWALSSDLYVKRAIADVETELGQAGKGLKTKVPTPLSSGYRPELDVSPELDERRASYFQGLIGVLRWMVELGRVDIMVGVSMLSRYLAMPRTGHLEETLHIFAYLKAHPKSAMVMDDSVPRFDESRFAKCDWSEFYPGAEEPVAPNAPELRGNSVTTSAFVDADHAGCRVTRRSHTGIFVFINRAPVMWYSKRQNTVESSTFGSEFVAMKIAVEQCEALRYKLRMFGVPVDGPTNVFCDNESVFQNSTRPESTLKKKHNAIAYHRTREAQAAGIVRIAWEDGRFNIADLLTKLLPGPKLKELVRHILW